MKQKPKELKVKPFVMKNGIASGGNYEVKPKELDWEFNWQYDIQRILLRNFDNDKYLWSKAHKEMKSFISSLLTQQRTELLEEIDKQWAELMGRSGLPEWYVWLENGQLRCLKGSRKDYIDLIKK